MSVTFHGSAARDFNRTLLTEARSWDDGVALDAQPGRRDAYVAAAKHLTRLIVPLVPPEIGQHGVAIESGLLVAACFAHTAASLAARQQLDQTTLYHRARAAGSYQTVRRPATTTKHIAHAIEHYTGLWPSDWHDPTLKLDQYTVTEQGFSLADPEQTIDQATYYWNNGYDGNELPAGKCPAQQFGMISSVHRAMVEVANRDCRLFAATLAHGL